MDTFSNSHYDEYVEEFHTNAFDECDSKNKQQQQRITEAFVFGNRKAEQILWEETINSNRRTIYFCMMNLVEMFQTPKYPNKNALSPLHIVFVVVFFLCVLLLLVRLP